ncbi:uncharacterized protein BDW43DRAFT_99248 [Aspergillus alliaceus]|uniref:uncharacterized protein n=1 Tax=Petromyces alliaceus TaxID=209559 RepID=UPI0012A56FA1|nr:uncharacterized protein BDW43DRAFT_99248 [Aspergillus alliaceus]KAB8232948.1 hypothetical protein BDW43DRAFT_99248 [Aspergillus alliaceus]
MFPTISTGYAPDKMRVVPRLALSPPFFFQTVSGGSLGIAQALKQINHGDLLLLLFVLVKGISKKKEKDHEGLPHYPSPLLLVAPKAPQIGLRLMFFFLHVLFKALLLSSHCVRTSSQQKLKSPWVTGT